MPKWRKLHVKILDSEDFNEFPDDFTRLFWVLLPLVVDSEGRGKDIPSWLKSNVFPLREDVSYEQIEKGMQCFEDNGMIGRYEVGGRKYFYLVNFSHYQGNTEKEAESVIPAPSGLTPDLLKSNSSLDSDSDADAEEMQAILTTWKELFPEKSQPKLRGEFQRKLKMRLRSSDFREKWQAALERSAKSPTLHDASWYDLNFFVRDDENYLKCLDGWMDWKDKERAEERPAIGTPGVTYITDADVYGYNNYRNGGRDGRSE